MLLLPKSHFARPAIVFFNDRLAVWMFAQALDATYYRIKAAPESRSVIRRVPVKSLTQHNLFAAINEKNLREESLGAFSEADFTINRR